MSFFREVFGWTFQQFGDMPYWLVVTGDRQAPGIDGAIMQRMHPDQPLVNTIHVDNLDEAIEQIEVNGGTMVVPKTAIPGMGYYAHFKDPLGTIHGLHQLDSEAK